MTENRTQPSVERPENVPSGYFWLVGGMFFALIALVGLFTVPIAAVIPGGAAWFCFYVGSMRSKRHKAAVLANR